MSTAVDELLLVELEVSDDVAVVAGVAAHLDDDVAESALAAVALLLLLVWVSFCVAVWAAESVAWIAMAPPRPSSAATLAVAVTLRARRAGWARFHRGVESGITRSFV